jgi:deoxycytidine triphosphate deaminase
MLLADTEIKALCANEEPLITDFDPKLLSVCTYAFRIGRMFCPPDGPTQNVTLSSDLVVLAPNETVLLMTKERIQLPNNLLATYSPLNSLARQGLMLLNASVVEPGYKGNLSCVLVNLSSGKIPLRVGERVAKVVFHRLNDPQKPEPLEIDEARYGNDLESIAATRYHRSFLNVNAVALQAANAATQAARSSIILGGILVAVLLAFAQIEPFVSKWLWEKTGIGTTATQVELRKRELDIRAVEADLQTHKRDLDAQRRELDLLKQKYDLELREAKIANASRDGKAANSR